MVKAIKKTLSGTLLVMALAFSANISAGAANLGWSGYASTPGSSIYTSNATKYTSSSIPFVNYRHSSSSIGVITQVRRYNSRYNFVNATCPGTNYVINNDGVYYFIKNYAYEKYNSKCNVRLRLVGSARGSYSGKWRPDC